MEKKKFQLITSLEPKGGQEKAIKEIVKNYPKARMQTLLGLTGSGKTFVMANVIAQLNKPTLILSPNKTLAAQLYEEMKNLFPKNRVEYFVSYFDYYQPESYLPATDTYIEKDSAVNAEIERMRLKAMSSVLTRSDVIIVASVSCIYGVGNPEDFAGLSYEIKQNDNTGRTKLIHKLIDMQYERNDMELQSGRFQVKGDTISVIPSYEENIIKIELFGDEIEKITELDPQNYSKINDIENIRIFPAKQFVVGNEKIEGALISIEDELEEHAPTLLPLLRHRLEQRTKYDMEMIREVGYCNGIENYSRHFDGRSAGEKPYTVLDFLPKEFLLIIDESHVAVPQVHGMYKGDYSRKNNLVEHGFRLPCAFDNRPLKFEEFKNYMNHVLFVSATPADYEVEVSDSITNLIIRPTGLLDPKVTVKPKENQIDDLISEINKTTSRGNRVFVTTITKRMAEDLTNYLAKASIKVRYLHSEIETIERSEIIRELRLGEFDVLVGINLLREGLDVPEVELVAILDADKQGFLRNERSLIQIIGRAARNKNGRVVMYADQTSSAMKSAIEITQRRRQEQEKYNKKHNITPQSVVKSIGKKKVEIKSTKHIPDADIKEMIINFEAEMQKEAAKLNFEKAILLRNQIDELNKRLAAKK